MCPAMDSYQRDKEFGSLLIRLQQWLLTALDCVLCYRCTLLVCKNTMFDTHLS
jgi:hypothetical protein